MGIDLEDALAWKSATADELAMLSDLQGNILKGHGRHAARLLFLQFGRDVARAKTFVRDISTLIISAQEQLRQADAYKLVKLSGGPFVAFYLSFEGYGALNLEALAPPDATFREGMKSRGGDLNDPAVENLDRGYRGPLHALVLIAGDPDDKTSWTSSAVDDLETKILNLLGGAGKVVASEAGRAIFNAGGGGLEHFGYVDGRSQPLLLKEDVEREKSEGGIDVWDPKFPLSQVLVKDPGSSSPAAFGSYFVFRKLEQNVKAFKKAEEGLGALAGNGELAGATIVGRWEDGTSIELFGHDGEVNPISNNFTYAGDPNGARCPIHGHVRKTNPRGESATRFGIPLKSERDHIMARRGIPYGRRVSTVDPKDEPEGGVGLLFMAYQSDIANQFEFTQISWANNDAFLAPGTGLDPIIGQGGSSVLRHPKAWNDPAAGSVDQGFGGFVTMKGGEYFFAPARSTLANV